MNTNQVLAPLGLQLRKSTGDYLWPALGVFGTGIMVGAGVALILAPKPGHELRRDIGRTAGRVRQKVVNVATRASNHLDDSSDLTRDELYSRAEELDIDGRSRMTKEELAQAVQSA